MLLHEFIYDGKFEDIMRFQKVDISSVILSPKVCFRIGPSQTFDASMDANPDNVAAWVEAKPLCASRALGRVCSGWKQRVVGVETCKCSSSMFQLQMHMGIVLKPM